MRLEDIKPKQSEFTLSKTGKTYVLRPWSLSDQIWMNQTYGEKVKEIFSKDNIDIVAICRMAFRVMEDKSDFKAEQVTEINEEGEEFTYSVGGYKKLISTIANVEEQLHVFGAVVECIGLSMPEVDEIKSLKLDEGEEKKSQKKSTGRK